jgi:hypothetical protein
MSHPAVLACASRTSTLYRKMAEIDARFAASEDETMELVASSRDAIKRSHDLLNKLKAR